MYQSLALGLTALVSSAAAYSGRIDHNLDPIEVSLDTGVVVLGEDDEDGGGDMEGYFECLEGCAESLGECHTRNDTAERACHQSAVTAYYLGLVDYHGYALLAEGCDAGAGFADDVCDGIAAECVLNCGF